MRFTGLAAAALIVSLIVLAGVAAALTAQEAEKEFKAKGCTGCHSGGLAPTFQGTVKKIEEWAKKYGSLDEAVAAESKNFKMFKGVKTWDELMSKMPGITPEFKQFFEQVFEQAKKGGAGGQAGGQAAQQPATAAKPVTVTVTKVKTVTQSVTEKVYVTETVTPPDKAAGTADLIAKASYVAAILVAVAVVALAYMFMGRRQ